MVKTYEAIIFLFTVSTSFVLVCDHAEQQIPDILAPYKEQSGETGTACGHPQFEWPRTFGMYVSACPLMYLYVSVYVS